MGAAVSTTRYAAAEPTGSLASSTGVYPGSTTGFGSRSYVDGGGPTYL